VVTAAAKARVWAAPRYEHPILVTPGDQIRLGEGWLTVIGTGTCTDGHDRGRDGVCVVVQLGHRDHHATPGPLLWQRRAVQR
jgi:hypothetical protein